MENNKTNRAVIIAVDANEDFESGKCSPLAPLVDRPFLQHMVECLVERGFKQIDFVLHDHERKFEEHFEDGQRWGASLKYHLVKDRNHPYSRLVSIVGKDLGSFLLLHADQLQPEGWMENRPADEGIAGFYWTNDEKQWTGAVWIATTQLKSLELSGTQEEFEQSIASHAQILVAEPLQCSTFQSLLRSQVRVLAREFPELLRFGREAEPGVWIGRNVCLHPAIQIEAPVFIGSNCQVDSNTKLGPSTVVTDGCYVNKDCEISNALLLPDTLVGEGLAIEQCVLDRFRLFHVQHNVAVSVSDELLIGSTAINIPSTVRIRRFCSRLVALVALIVASPILLLLATIQKLRYGRAFFTEEVVKLPCDVEPWTTFQRIRINTMRSPGDQSNLRHLFFELLPGLINVVRGDMGWVGVTPLRPTEVKKMSDDWREIYARCEAGLITESIVNYGHLSNQDEVLTSEVYYAVAVKNFSGRVKRAWAYLASLLFGPRAARY